MKMGLGKTGILAVPSVPWKVKMEMVLCKNLHPKKLIHPTSSIH